MFLKKKSQNKRSFFNFDRIYLISFFILSVMASASCEESFSEGSGSLKDTEHSVGSLLNPVRAESENDFDYTNYRDVFFAKNFYDEGSNHCTDNFYIKPESVSFKFCPNGPPKILDYDKACDSSSAADREACGVQVYQKMAEELGDENGCMTWTQLLALIYFKEIGNNSPLLPRITGTRYYPDIHEFWSLISEAGVRLLRQRIGRLDQPNVFGFICTLGTVESFYVRSNLSSMNNDFEAVGLEDFDGYENFLPIARDKLNDPTLKEGFAYKRPATWENIIDPQLSHLLAIGFGPENLAVGNSDKIKEILGRGYYPIASVPGNEDSAYSDPNGNLYITVTHYYGATMTGIGSEFVDHSGDETVHSLPEEGLEGEGETVIPAPTPTPTDKPGIPDHVYVDGNDE